MLQTPVIGVSLSEPHTGSSWFYRGTMVTFPKVYVISTEGLGQHMAYSIHRVENVEERQERLARRRECYWKTSHHYWTCWFSMAKVGQPPYLAWSQEKMTSQHQICQNFESLQDNGTVAVYTCKLQCYSCMWSRVHVPMCASCNKTYCKVHGITVSAICLTYYRLHIARMKYSSPFCSQPIPSICM